MNDKPTGAAGAFDVAAWREELLALNPWARWLTTNDKNFAAARQKAMLERHEQGTEMWNAWAQGMLALKTALQMAGWWSQKHYSQETVLWIELSTAVFSTDLARRTFNDEVTFSAIVFPGVARFEGATFAGGAKFVGATFSGDAGFEGATFSGSAEFEGATFSGDARFMEATFSGGVVFGGTTTFSGSALFMGATFSGGAWFVGATFSGDARFGRVTFSGDARFEAVTFSGDASFEGATFSGDARFDGATFSGEAKLKRATFSENTYLNKVRFIGPANFSLAKFVGQAVLNASEFQEDADFEGLESTGTFSLANAKFRQVPNYTGASFRGLRLDNVRTPRFRLTLGWTSDGNAAARFRELKRRANEAQDREREIEFFAQEIRTSRFHVKKLPTFVPRILEWRFWFGLLFGTFSDFGRSLWRPAVFWFILAAISFMFYLGEHEEMRKARAVLNQDGLLSSASAYMLTTMSAWSNPPACRPRGKEMFASTDAFAEAVNLSLANAVVVDTGRGNSSRRTYGCLYGFETAGDQEYARVSSRVSRVSTVQSLASGVLLLLFLLAVRNLLRLK